MAPASVSVQASGLHAPSPQAQVVVVEVMSLVEGLHEYSVCVVPVHVSVFSTGSASYCPSGPLTVPFVSGLFPSGSVHAGSVTIAPFLHGPIAVVDAMSLVVVSQ